VNRRLNASSSAVAPVQDSTWPPRDDLSRFALRRIASGVAVLTVSQNGLAHGATVNAITAISRDPVVLGVCLRTSSVLADMAMRVGLFSVNVLTRDQSALATRFAQPGRRPGAAQFRGLEWSADRRTAAPLLAGCLAHLGCRVAGHHQIGDHDLIVAEVIDGAAGHGSPLLTFAGRLHGADPDLALVSPIVAPSAPTSSPHLFSAGPQSPDNPMERSK